MLPDQATAIAELTDAFARGRVCLGELLQLRAGEADALYALGCARLATGHVQDAVVLFTTLCTLFPYRAAAWRALGVAYHRAGAVRRAVGAYSACLILDPGHPQTLCHLGEALLADDAGEAARGPLDAAAASDDPAVANRARACLAVLDAAVAPPPPAAPTELPPAPATDFALPDGRSLPLREGRNAADALPPLEETADPGRLYRTPRAVPAERSVTETAVVARPRPAPAPMSAAGSHSDTARIARRRGNAAERRHLLLPLETEITLTDVMLRR